MSNSTTGYSPSVPVTNGHSTWVPEPGIEIWRPGYTDGGTVPQITPWERVYPLPEQQESKP